MKDTKDDGQKFALAKSEVVSNLILEQKFNQAWEIREKTLDHYYGPTVVSERIKMFSGNLEKLMAEIDARNMTAAKEDYVTGLYFDLNETDYLKINLLKDWKNRHINIHLEPDSKEGMEKGVVHDFLTCGDNGYKSSLRVYSDPPESFDKPKDNEEAAKIMAVLNKDFVDECVVAGISKDNLVALGSMQVVDDETGRIRMGVSLGIFGTMRDVRENALDMRTLEILEKAVEGKQFYTPKLHKQKTNG